MKPRHESNNDADRDLGSNGPGNVLSPIERAEALARVDDRILDPAKRDEVLVFGKKTALVLAAILAVICMFAEWHSKIAGYSWQAPEWALILIIAPFGGLAASLAYLFQKVTRGHH